LAGQSTARDNVNNAVSLITPLSRRPKEVWNYKEKR